MMVNSLTITLTACTLSISIVASSLILASSINFMSRVIDNKLTMLRDLLREKM